MIPAGLQRGGAAPNLCATYKVRLVDRDGGNVCDLPAVTGTWHWVLQATGFADLAIDLDDGCCGCEPEPWLHSIEIERHGPTGREGVVWSGPVVRSVRDPGNGGWTVTVQDRSAWWSRRPRARRRLVGTMDPAVGWRELALDAEQGDPSGLVIPPARPTGLTYEFDVAVSSATDPGTDIAALLFGGLPGVSWTIIDRHVYGPGPTTVGSDEPWDTLRTGVDWVDDVTVLDRDGTTYATQVRVFGKNAAGAAVAGVYPAGSRDEGRGHHIQTVTVEGVWTAAGIQAEAERRYLAARVPTLYLVTSSGSLAPDAPVTPWDLIPGRVFLIAHTDFHETHCGEEHAHLMRVYNTAVQFGPGPGGLVEQRVAVDLRPVGAEAGSGSQDRLSI